MLKKSLKNQLIVSCQALVEEPLHSSFIMGRMALAAFQGGAKGIRANSVEDIQVIKSIINLPIIGIIKKDYPNSDVYISPTKKEIDALATAKVDIIAIDATARKRPEDSLPDLVEHTRKAHPNILLMADISTIEEAIFAEELGFDFIGTTLYGYTANTVHLNIADNDFEFLKQLLNKITTPIIAEGKIDSPEKAKYALELGAYCVVVGGAITRPQELTKKFVSAINIDGKETVNELSMH